VPLLPGPPPEHPDLRSLAEVRETGARQRVHGLPDIYLEARELRGHRRRERRLLARRGLHWAPRPCALGSGIGVPPPRPAAAAAWWELGLLLSQGKPQSRWRLARGRRNGAAEVAVGGGDEAAVGRGGAWRGFGRLWMRWRNGGARETTRQVTCAHWLFASALSIVGLFTSKICHAASQGKNIDRRVWLAKIDTCQIISIESIKPVKLSFKGESSVSSQVLITLLVEYRLLLPLQVVFHRRVFGRRD
jgi:hypothetical protein